MLKITLEIDSNDIAKLNIPSNIWEVLASNGRIRVRNAESDAANDTTRLSNARGIADEVDNMRVRYVEENTSNTDGIIGNILEVLDNAKRPLGLGEIAHSIRYSYGYVKQVLRVMRNDGLVVSAYDRYKHCLLYATKRNVHYFDSIRAKKTQKSYTPCCSLQAKRNVLRKLLSSEKPLTGYDLLKVCDYAYTYIQAILRDLKKEGLVEAVVEKTKHFYKPTEKAEKAQEYQAA